MKKRILSLLVAAVMVLSLGGFYNSAQAVDADPEAVTIVIDLTEYTGSISGTFGGVEEEPIELKAGQYNVLVTNDWDAFAAEFTLNDFAANGYSTWLVEGNMGMPLFDGNEHQENEYIEYTADETVMYVLPVGSDPNQAAITINDGNFVMGSINQSLLQYGWGLGTILFFKPVAAQPQAPTADPEAVTIVIDLTEYTGSISGTFGGVEEEPIELKAGQYNVLVTNDWDAFAADFTLNDFAANGYSTWLVEGSMGMPQFDGNEHQASEYIEYTNEADETVMYVLPVGSDPNQAAITINDGNFVMGSINQSLLQYGWGLGTILFFKPVAAQVNLNVTASSADETKGTATVSGAGGSSFTFTAAPAEGYSFAYWLPEGAEDTAENRILENPYTVELTADASYLAYFRERYSVNAAAADESMGTVASVYLGSANGADRYRLTATAGQYYEFEKWTWGESGSSTENPCEVSVTADGETYTAHFTPIQIGLLAGATLTKIGNYEEGLNTGIQPRGSSVPVGSRALLNVPFSASNSVSGAQLRVTVSVGDTVIAVRSLSGRLNKGENNFFNVLIDPVPAGAATLTIQTELTTPGGTSSATRTYEGFTIEDSETNSSFAYVTSPAQQGGTGGYTVENGVSATGSYAELNAQTGALSLYFYGMNGVYVWKPDGETDIKAMNADLVFDISGGERGVFALGSDGEGGLIAAVETLAEDIDAVTTPGYDSSVTGASGSHFLWRWNGESWSKIENSCFSYYPPSGGGVRYDSPQIGDGCRAALICSATDIWTDRYHWNGSAWSAHDYSFVSFTNSTVGRYAVDSNGDRWQYDGTDWTNVGAVNAPEVDPRVYYEGTTWQDANGEWYLIVPGRIHKVANSYQGSDVYKWNGSRWVYQIMSMFNDPNDDPLEGQLRIRPDYVSTLCSPSAGVSILCGHRSAGATYISLGDVSITFDPGEGALDNAALAALTAPIFSEIDSTKVPGASRSGCTFEGWYYDEAYTVKFEETGAYMPGRDVTLYAKWSEGSGNQLSYYKQKALAALEKQYHKYSSADYTAENWSALQSAYIQGISNINNATAGSQYIDDNVNAALNSAIAAMQAIPSLNTGTITVAVSMDANTLGLGYLIKPTLVTVNKNQQVSEVTTQLIEQMAAEEFGVTGEGLSQKGVREPEAQYPWIITGTPTSSFYLSQVYYPRQEDYQIPDTLSTFIADHQLVLKDEEDVSGSYLGEFDYLETSGWMYSVGDKTTGGASFPGVGASGWSLSDGEVVRWQFTLVGYGADLGADNTQWGSTALINAADKSALTWKVAELRSEHRDATLEANDVYNAAMAVLTDAEATQAQVDAALEALNAETFPEEAAVTAANTESGSTVTAGDETLAIASYGSASVSAAADGEAVTITVETSKVSIILACDDYGTGENTFTVVSDDKDTPCTILVKDGESYVPATVSTTDGVHTVTLPADAEIVVAVKGDSNGDGVVDVVDVVAAKAVSLGLRDASALDFALLNVAYDSKIDVVDVVALKAVSLSLRAFSW